MKGFILTVSLLAIFSLTTCDIPLGMGQPIDFEPPVLTLDPKPPTPFYVGSGAELTGTVTDNVAVDRVILRDSVTGKQIFKATLLSGNRWQINLEFTEDQNGETILADVVAFDKMGNSGAESIASVVLIIDIRPPIIEDIWIQRSSTKTADIEQYLTLKELEITDPNGEIIDNVNKYQNGAFYVEARVSEKESRIKSVLLKLYDNEYPDIELVSLQPESGSAYSPRWLITEDMILGAGNSKLPDVDYESNYKINNKRYYYRLRIIAIDYSDNENENNESVNRIEDKGYLCLWQKADYPKGFLDTLVVGGGKEIIGSNDKEYFITKGSALPVIFFDDDKIEWAYAALFTKEQWMGQNEIAAGVKILAGTDDEKFNFLINTLNSGTTIYNWRYDSFRAKTPPDSEPVVNLTPNPVDEKTYYIVTGNDPKDYGEFVFVSLVKDLKLSPHNTKEDPDTRYPDVIKSRKYNINLIDENAPLIVFDKSGGSPEENTFPILDSKGNFKIFGYTLREDKTGPLESLNYVAKFGLAWIPFNIKNTFGGPEENIAVVKKALAGEETFPVGVQYWDLTPDVLASNDTETIGGTNFKKQHFSKTFSILGGKDDEKDYYNNFVFNNELENTTKLFVFYAEDNSGNIVYSQFYLLGNKTPPSIEIYDITDRLTTLSAPDVFDYSSTGAITPEYIAARETFNKEHYKDLKNVSSGLDKNDEAETYRAYPRGTNIKFWAKAKTNGDLALTSIKMEDITYQIADGETYPKLGFYEDADYALSYVEYFPEVTQRVFLFTARDSLGNEAKVQRTIAIANAATLTSITTAEQNGTYPAGKTIELKANFDGMIKLESNNTSTKPKLNVLYKINSTYTVQSITCEDVDSNGQLYLNFKFTVPPNAQGRLETFYVGLPNNPGSIDRPITVNSANKILDYVRGDAAYTPGNVTGFTWKDAAHSLQYDSVKNVNGKNINLDGIIPTITAIKITDTKAPYSTSPNLYYLKSGESLSIELTASKNLKISGNTSLQFRLQRPDNIFGANNYTAYNNTAFEYRKVTANKIVFTLDVTKANIINEDHGRLSDISIYNADNITDDAGNKIDVSTFTALLTAFNNASTGNTIRFDLVPPKIPGSTLTPSAAGGGGAQFTLRAVTDGTKYYTITPFLEINVSAPDAEEPYAQLRRQYSLNNGLRWVDFPTKDTDWGTTDTGGSDRTGGLYIHNGMWTVKTRYIDLAGNEGAATEQLIHVNNTFPKLIAVKVSQPNATYIGGQTLDFTLDFEDDVTVPASGVTLTLRDLTSTTPVPGGLSLTYESPAIPATTNTVLSRTVKFTWSLIKNSKDMPNGLKIYTINISGLKDKFGNQAPSGSAVIADTSISLPGDTAVSYDFSKIIVSTIAPRVTSRIPETAKDKTGNITSSVSGDNKTIILNFNKPMQKGNGTITIRPHSNYAIPAVFENDGYYITYTYDSKGNVTGETRSSTAGTDSIYVSGFYDIYIKINSTDRNTLIGGTMSAPALSNVTGLSIGPYLKTTHGLTQGAGYTGNYGNPNTPPANNPNDAIITLPGINAPGTRSNTDNNGDGKNNFMIPDVETKWVLAYVYGDLFSNTGTVSNIRAVLDRAKFRWQEIAVTNPNVKISGSTVTITLSEPLLPGLQWDLFYTEGTFTDTAGNKAAGENRGDYWFWSNGVQKPVIRVDRKSFDARTGGNVNYTGDIYNTTSYYNANGYNGTIGSFNTINYRITSETPNARIEYITKEGKDFKDASNQVPIGSITADWTGRVTSQTIPSITNTANITWDGPKNMPTSVTGTWVRPNLIFRNTAGTTYYIMEEGINISKVVRGDTQNSFAANNGNYYGFRSYNKDATFKELDGLTPNNVANSAGDSFTYDNSGLEASKNYVVSQARIDHVHTGGTYTSTDAISSQKGFEGVFRTVIAFNQSGLTAANGSDGANPMTAASHPILLDGSNVRSGMPTISGFPVRDNGSRTESRYTKVFYRDGKYFYWVSSEIISPWYIQPYGRGDGGGGHGNSGDIEDWISAGYGDLIYVLNLVRS